MKPDMDRQLSRSHQLRWTESTNGQVLRLELLELVSAEQARELAANCERGAHQQQLPWALAPWIMARVQAQLSSYDQLRAAIALQDAIAYTSAIINDGLLQAAEEEEAREGADDREEDAQREEEEVRRISKDKMRQRRQQTTSARGGDSGQWQ